MTFDSQSQVGQDAWVKKVLVDGERRLDGLFLEVGCNHPKEISNTWALEQIGWSGYLVDNDEYCCRLCRGARLANVIECDSTKFDWSTLPTKHFDYLSLDVDNATAETLDALLKGGITFRLATIEDDRYRFGNGPRDQMREKLLGAGYVEVCPDVVGMNGTDIFESWWADRDTYERHFQ